MDAREDREHPERSGDLRRGDERPESAARLLAPGATTEEILCFDRASIRALDRAAETELGMPALLLMENAAIGIAMHAERFAARNRSSGAVVVCGRGNNGGDGLGAARRLSLAGWRAAVVVLSGPSTGAKADSPGAVNLRIVRGFGLPVFEVGAGDPHAGHEALDRAFAAIKRVDLIIDGVLGTGAEGEVRGAAAGLIRAVNDRRSSTSPVLAIDLPSGLDADLGIGLVPTRPGQPGTAVHADLTVTLVGHKKGFMSLAAQEFIGEVVVSGIGVPRWFARKFAEAPGAPLHPGDSPEIAWGDRVDAPAPGRPEQGMSDPR